MNWEQKKNFESLLKREEGFVKKVWGAFHSVCLAYPNAYRVGMANLGFQTVYKIFNDLPSFLCERAFLPAPDGDAEFAAPAARLVSLESQRPLGDFDILAFSLSFENDYPAVLTMLEAAGIPLLAKDRRDVHPLVIGGGIAPTLNPEPIADFFDLFILGEAEEALPIFAELFLEGRHGDIPRAAFLSDLQQRGKNVYIPSLYCVDYFPDGRIKSVAPQGTDLPSRIHLLPVKNIDAFSTTEVISSPDAEMADMYLIEVNRGCPRMCRFCAAAHVYCPPRFRVAEGVMNAVDEGLSRKRKIGLVGTAVSDHPDLAKIGRHILERGGQAGIGSLRIDQVTVERIEWLKACGIETVALAPEAGSQRLRDVLRKGVTEEDIFKAADVLMQKDLVNVRLYFMVGLPTEEEEDIDAIIDLVGKIQHTALSRTAGRRKFRRMTLSINQFIPKPRTPFQWCSLADVQDAGRKIKKITKAFKTDRQIHVVSDVPKWNYVQALLSLGDRRVGGILRAVHRLKGNWKKALKSVNVNPDFYVYREKDKEEFLPWDIVDVGLPKKHLIREYQKALRLACGRAFMGHDGSIE